MGPEEDDDEEDEEEDDDDNEEEEAEFVLDVVGKDEFVLTRVREFCWPDGDAPASLFEPEFGRETEDAGFGPTRPPGDAIAVGVVVRF